MSSLEAVIFDMDGVLIDSEPFWMDSEIEVFGRAGVTLTPADCNQTVGMRIDQVVDYWFERRPWDLGETSHEDLVNGVVDGVLRRVTSHGEMLPGVREAIAFFRSRSVRLALASSSSFAIIHHVLEAMDLRDAFEILHSAENELHGKPSPDVYITTLKLLGVPAESCLAIEDSRNGITAAKAAGIVCIGVPDVNAPDMTRFDHADVVLSSLTEIDASLLTKLGF